MLSVVAISADYTQEKVVVAVTPAATRLSCAGGVWAVGPLQLGLPSLMPFKVPLATPRDWSDTTLSCKVLVHLRVFLVFRPCMVKKMVYIGKTFKWQNSTPLPIKIHKTAIYMLHKNHWVIVLLKLLRPSPKYCFWQSYWITLYCTVVPVEPAVKMIFFTVTETHLF